MGPEGRPGSVTECLIWMKVVGRVLAFCALVAGLLPAAFFLLQRIQNSPGLRFSRTQPHCAVYQPIDAHLDVAMSLAFVFQEAGCKTSVYLPAMDAGVVEASTFYQGSAYHPMKGQVLEAVLESHLPSIDVLVFTTFPGWGAGEFLQRALVRRGLQPAATPKPSVVVGMLHGSTGVPTMVEYLNEGENSWLQEALNSSTEGKGKGGYLGCHRLRPLA